MKRHPDNSHLHLTDESHWEGLPLMDNHGPYSIEYLDNILMTLKDALEAYPRVCIIRFDLRFPSGKVDCREAISRFFPSLQSQVDADQARKARAGRRSFPFRLRYVWAAEQDSSAAPHYHVAVMVNKDAYHSLGRFPSVEGQQASMLKPSGASMADRILRAWARALRMDPISAVGLVHFPKNAIYYINVGGVDIFEQYCAAFRRLSYLAKSRTKRYGVARRNFGCSRPRLVPRAIDSGNFPRTQPIA